MKKLTSLFFVALFVLILSGCDLIGSETIEKVTEELCRDNPDHQLCQEDALTNLEESVVLDLFNDMLNSYIEADLDGDGYCDSYISVTNIELLDKCRTDINSLFPEGIEDFIILSVAIEDNEYKVELQSKNYADKIIFSIKTGFENDKIVITKMAYGPIFVLSPPNAKEDILDLIHMFILDMESDLLTDAQVCAIWDGIDDDCDGIDVARRKFKAGADLSKKVNIIEIEDPTDDDTRDLIAEVEYTDNGHVTVLKIAFNVDIIEDELRLFILDPDSDGDTILDLVEGIEKDQIKRILEVFVDDFIDTTKSDLEICEIWYDGIDNDCNKVIEQRDTYLSAVDLTTMIDILDDDDDGDGLFESEISFTLDGHVTVLKIVVQIDTSTSEIKLTIIGNIFEDIGSMTLIPLTDALVILDEYVMHYNHMSMISRSMCETTMVEYQVDECSVKRDMMVSDGYMLFEYELSIVDNQYMIDFIYMDSIGNQILETKTVLFINIEKGPFLLELL